MNVRLVLKLFQLSDGDFSVFLACLQQLQTLCSVRNSKFPNLGKGT